MMTRRARDANLEIIYAPQMRRTLASSMPPGPIQRQSTITDTTKAKDVSWAVRQGRMDRKAGIVCRKYQQFCKVYGLKNSKLARQMWTAYVAPSTPQRKKRGKGGSVWTVSGGLPTLGKRSR